MVNLNWFKGFMDGDGGIYDDCISICLSQRDSETLEKIRIFLKKNEIDSKIYYQSCEFLRKKGINANDRCQLRIYKDKKKFKNLLKKAKKDLDWCIGFIDAEGSFSIRKGKNNKWFYFWPEINLNNSVKDLKFFKILQEYFKGKIYFLRNETIIYKIYRKKDILNFIMKLSGKSFYTKKQKDFILWKQFVLKRFNSKNVWNKEKMIEVNNIRKNMNIIGGNLRS